MKNAKTIINYSRALFELAETPKQQEAFLQELNAILPCITPDLLAFAENPGFHGDEKKQVVLELASRLKLHESVRAFLVLVVTARRLRDFKEIIRLYQQMLFASQGKRLLEIETTQPLKESERQEILKTFEGVVNGKLEISETIKPELIGGVLVRLGSKVYDGSIQGRLRDLRARLMEV